MKSKLSITVILGLVIGGLGIISPILWEHYKTKSGIELQHLSSLTILEDKYRIEKLKILYDGKAIRDISKMVFRLVNTGRTPIQEDDLTSPPTITFTRDVEILDIQRERVSPRNLDFDYEMDPNDKKIVIRFPLLNPGDFIQFSILVTGEIDTYEAAARIVGVKELSVIDRREELQKERKRITWSVYPVGVFSFISLIVALSQIVPDIRKGMRMKEELRIGKLNFPRFDLPKRYLDYIDTSLFHKLESSKKHIKRFIKNLPEDSKLTLEDQKQFESQLSKLIEDESANWGALFIFLIIATAGIVYILTKLL